jgi:hypothetical protein
LLGRVALGRLWALGLGWRWNGGDEGGVVGAAGRLFGDEWRVDHTIVWRTFHSLDLTLLRRRCSPAPSRRYAITISGRGTRPGRRAKGATTSVTVPTDAATRSGICQSQPSSSPMTTALLAAWAIIPGRSRPVRA